MVEAAGGVPVLLVPPATGTPEKIRLSAAEAAIQSLDALVLTGGTDVDPALYGAVPHERSQRPDVGRDAYELAVVAAAATRDLPLLAICRGMQLLNVARCGTLVQHLPDLPGRRSHQASPGQFAAHCVDAHPRSRLASLYGSALSVLCHHHQAVDQVGQGLVISATAEDGTIEALDDPAARFVMAVQWHPEEGKDATLFRALVAAAVLPDPSTS
jgi:putative glutamine amidotransferase